MGIVVFSLLVVGLWLGLDVAIIGLGFVVVHVARRAAQFLAPSAGFQR